MSIDHEASSMILEDFVQVMNECGSWPDEEADMMRLAEVAHRAHCHLKGIPNERRCPQPLPTKQNSFYLPGGVGFSPSEPDCDGGSRAGWENKA